MMNQLTVRVKEALAYIFAERFSLLVTLLLLFVLPILFLYSGQAFLEAGRAQEQRLQRDRLGLLHDSLALLVRGQSQQFETLTSDLVAGNADIMEVSLLRVAGEEIVLISSASTSAPLLEPEITMLQTALLDPSQSYIFEQTVNGIRYWQSVRAISVDSSHHFTYVVTNLEAVDRYFADAARSAYFALAFVFLILAVLVWWQLRQIGLSAQLRKVEGTLATRDQFTNALVHELRTPLTAIKGYASMLRESDSTAKEVAVIETVSSHMLELVNDLLDVARLQSGNLSIEKVPVPLAALLDELFAELLPIASERQLTLTRSTIANDLSVLADETRLRQIVRNIISNALKYTKKGGVTVTAESNDRMVALRIADTGMGIEAADQAKLFAPFFRVESREVAATTGTGLGMWVTKELVARMDGTVAIESIKGIGTHVIITLPRA